MHSDVLHLIDTHLAELQALRRDLTSSRQIRPGARFDAASATLQSTRHFASELSLILTQPAPPDDLTSSAAPAELMERAVSAGLTP
jgi:hypothetical protein